MTAAEDLAVVIGNFRDDWYKVTRMAPAGIDRDEAKAILAAGYRKPRPITTPEELDALRAGSVVLHNGRAFQRYPAYPAPFDDYQKWKCGDGGFVRSTKDGSSILPATVIHEPAAP